MSNEAQARRDAMADAETLFRYWCEYSSYLPAVVVPGWAVEPVNGPAFAQYAASETFRAVPAPRGE